MVNILLIASVILFVATLLWIGLRGATASPETWEEVASRLKPVNVEALLNLLDEQQDAYFARSLSAEDLRWLRRQRNVVAIEYVWGIVQNAALVIRVAELAMKSPMPEIAQAGGVIANSALTTRLLALKTLFYLGLGVIVPSPPLRVPMVQDYLNLNTQVFRLGKTSRRSA